MLIQGTRRELDWNERKGKKEHWRFLFVFVYLLFISLFANHVFAVDCCSSLHHWSISSVLSICTRKNKSHCKYNFQMSTGRNVQLHLINKKVSNINTSNRLIIKASFYNVAQLYFSSSSLLAAPLSILLLLLDNPLPPSV